MGAVMNETETDFPEPPPRLLPDGRPYDLSQARTLWCELNAACYIADHEPGRAWLLGTHQGARYFAVILAGVGGHPLWTQAMLVTRVFGQSVATRVVWLNNAIHHAVCPADLDGDLAMAISRIADDRRRDAWTATKQIDR